MSLLDPGVFHPDSQTIMTNDIPQKASSFVHLFIPSFAMGRPSSLQEANRGGAERRVAGRWAV